MKNPFIQRVPNSHAYYFLALALGAAYLIIWATVHTGSPETLLHITKAAEPIQAAEAAPVKVEAGLDTDTAPMIAPEGDRENMKVTWFGRECPTKWCKAHYDQPRGHVVAFNSGKYGYAKQVIIPSISSQPFDVIGNTDSKTDVDVWCLDDVACQKQVSAHGKHLIAVQIIR